MNKALILVDLENEWRDPKSEYYVGDLKDLIIQSNRLIDCARKQGYKIIFIQHIEKGSTTAFAEGSHNVELFQELNRKKDDVVVTKYTIGSFYKTSLEKELKGIQSIVVSGILTNLCVRSLVQDAYDREFDITVITDCCVAFDKKTHDFTLKDLKSTRPELIFSPLKDFIQ